MAEFHFSGSIEDSLAMFDALISCNRFTFVVDKWYTSPEVFQFTELPVSQREEVIHLGFYLWSEEYSRFAPHLGDPTSSNLRLLDERYGGPALRLLLPGRRTHLERIGIGFGWLSYLRGYYVDPVTDEAYKPPEGLKQAFKDVQRILRKYLVKRYMNVESVDKNYDPITVTKTLWIGKHAATLLQADSADVLFLGGAWRSGREIFQKPK